MTGAQVRAASQRQTRGVSDRAQKAMRAFDDKHIGKLHTARQAPRTNPLLSHLAVTAAIAVTRSLSRTLPFESSFSSQLEKSP